MLQDMLKDFFSWRLYIQLSPQRVLVRDPKSGRSVDEVPEIAVHHVPGSKRRVAAVGREARGMAAHPNTNVHNPFAHPRSLVSDFTLAEQLLKAFVRQVNGDRLFTPSPTIVLHPLGEHAGGLTQVELRALQQLAMGIGASGVTLWQGSALTDEQLLAGEFPASGRVMKA